MKTRRIWITSVPVTVELHDQEIITENERSFGDFDPYNLIIRTQVDLPPAALARTLVHEVFHACVTLTVGRASLTDKKDAEESFVRAAEIGWFSLLMDKRNKWFLDLIEAAK
jgi:hypothetical protein